MLKAKVGQDGIINALLYSGYDSIEIIRWPLGSGANVLKCNKTQST